MKADEFIDWLAVSRMNLLTGMARNILPKGFWGHKYQTPTGQESHPINLTFDDGPSPHTTPRLLDLLEEENIKATFFLIGSNVEKYPELAWQIQQKGHSIGNHSHRHKFMPALSLTEIEKDLDLSNKSIVESTGHTPRLFRAPYGLLDKRIASCLSEREMTAIYWSSAPEDWSLPGAKRVIRRVLWQLNPGSLIVLHEGEGLAEQTFLAAKEIILSCKRNQFSLAKI